MDLTPLLFAYLSAMVFLFGACVGSFLNVCIHRIPREESVIRPRSHCPACGTMIAWYDNVPLVRYLALGGRCRNCGGKISMRYFLVEALVGALFLLVWQRYGLEVRTPVYWMVAAGLVLGTFVDFEHLIIPDRVTLGGIAAGLLLSPLVPSMHGVDTPLRGFLASLASAATGWGILWMVAVLGKAVFRKDAMGFGDVKLLGAVGALLGWRAVIFTLMISSVAGSLVGVALILARRHRWQSRIPYGPYLAVAAMIWVVTGERWWAWYVGCLAGSPM